MIRRELLTLLGAGVPGLLLGGIARGQDRMVTSRIRLAGTRVVMPVTIGGEGPFDFMLDTGGFLSLIHDQVAQRLRLPVERHVRAEGVGGRATLPVFLARDVVFGGGARQSAVALAGHDRGFGQGVVGALAAGMVTAIDSDLDFRAGEWRAYPGGRGPREGFVPMRDALRAGGTGPGAGSKRLFGTASVNGRSGRFLLDTGAPGGLVLDHDIARRLGLWDDARPYAPTRPYGIGGEARIARIVRADVASFGGLEMTRPLVLLRGPGDGAGGDADGVIGLNLLKIFALSTDTRQRMLWVRPYADATMPPERYGMSGLWLDQRPAGWVVAGVGTGSPAAAAGIKIGDRIALDGEGDLLRALGGRPGSIVALRVMDGTAERTTQVRLAEFL